MFLHLGYLLEQAFRCLYGSVWACRLCSPIQLHGGFP